MAVHVVHGADANVDEYIDGIGIQAAAITGAAMFARSISSIPWTRICDIIGRKPVLLAGNLALMAFQIMFGLSTTLWQAVLSRFLLGLCTAIGPVGSIICFEVGTAEHRMRAGGYFTATWSCATVFASGLGGWLADPVGHFPDTFGEVDLLARFPYLLPNLCGAALSTVAAVLAAAFVPETRHLAHGPSSLERDKGLPEGVNDERNESNEKEDGLAALQNQEGSESMGKRLPPLVIEEDTQPSHGGVSPVQVLSPKLWNWDFAWNEDEKEAGGTGSADAGSPAPAPSESWQSVMPPERQGTLQKVRGLLSASHVRFNAVVSLLIDGIWYMFEESVALLVVATIDKGGFGWPASLSGSLLACQGVAIGLFLFLAFPALSRAIPLPRLLRLSCWMAVPAVMAFPASSYLTSVLDTWAVFLVALMAAACTLLCVSTAYTLSTVHMMGAVTADDRGVATGVLFVARSLGYGLASLVAGASTKLGLQGDLPFPLNHFFPFWWVALAMGTAAVLTPHCFIADAA
ncbi:unnamed protein product [Chrysoparadoxa australica]